MSPVGEPDLGEVNPLGEGTNLWAGRWTEVCRLARVEGALRFLDEEGVADPTLPSGFPPADQPTATHVLDGETRSGLPPRRQDNGVDITAREVAVYEAANGMGTVLFFDLGDGDTTAEEVEWALLAVRDEAERLGIPDLQPGPAFGGFHNDDAAIDCTVYDHPDHRAVHTALETWQVLDGPQLGRTCEHDADVDPTWTATIPDAAFERLRALDGQQRVGSFQRRYGWLKDEDWSARFEPNSMFSQTQWFWQRPVG